MISLPDDEHMLVLFRRAVFSIGLHNRYKEEETRQSMLLRCRQVMSYARRKGYLR